MSLVIVSNRVAAPDKRNQVSQGGLAVGLLEALRERGGTWFGWSGKISENVSPNQTDIENENIKFKTIDLTREEYNVFYQQYSNGTLWPLFHFRLDLAAFSNDSYLGYLKVNERFADNLAAIVSQDDLVWVHDYHFLPLAAALRRKKFTQKLGYFQHVPWPPKEILQALPNHKELISQLLEYDIIGFQTKADVRRFLDYVLNEFSGSIDPTGFVYADRKRTQVKHFPISIDFESFVREAQKSETFKSTEQLKNTVGNTNLILGVDRLDYSKGINNRLAAYQTLLENHPPHRRTTTFMQISPPTRYGVNHYKQLRKDIERKAGHINGTYSDFDWTAVRYLNKGYSRSTLAGFYRTSKIGMVTPLRDGMNLVAKEYVTAQSASDPGVLILSRFAGSAEELSGALIVNPYDVEELRKSMLEALDMPLDERLDRWAIMYQQIEHSDLNLWWNRFLNALKSVEL